jgi:hypothetical protein
LKLVRDESLVKTEACAYIVYEYKQPDADFYRVKLSFTSTKLDHDLSQINLLNCSKDSLPVEKCLKSIDEIRRTKWFSVKLKPIANAMLVLRVMRDFCRRTPTWFVLSDWLLELIVDKCFVRHKYEKVSLKFRTIFEAISSGMFFLRTLVVSHSTNATTGESVVESIDIVDPCKKDSTSSVFDSLTMQQKEDITSSAQHALRLIAFKRINQVLALDADEANLLFSSTTSSDKFISKKNEDAAKKQQDSVANDLDLKLNLLSQPGNDAAATAATTATTAPTAASNTAGATTTPANFDYETNKNFNENINNISMFILNNYASNIFDLCFSFLDLANLKN